MEGIEISRYNLSHFWKELIKKTSKVKGTHEYIYSFIFSNIFIEYKKYSMQSNTVNASAGLMNIGAQNLSQLLKKSYVESLHC